MKDSLSPEANSFSATHSIPCLSQNMWVHYHFHHSLTHTLESTFVSPTTSVLTHILHWTTLLLWPICFVHFKHHAETTKWGAKD